MSRPMPNNEGLTLTQAAKAMRLTPKTVRRHIKQGKIPFKLVPGKYGNEYRILDLPPEQIKERTLDTTPTLAMDIITRLEEENRNLAGQLGAAHEMIRTLETQVKMLTTPQKPWWRRLLRRKE